jgi:hypothetical protein
MSSATLTSLAMLKVNIDQGRDYLDYLRPFILQVLADHRPDPVTDGGVAAYLLEQYGMEIPRRAVQIVLRRLSREHPLKREVGVYRIAGELPDPGIVVEKSKAERHIRAVVSGLVQFSKTTGRELATEDSAVTALCAFLAEFSIPCFRAYLRGTAIPSVEGRHDTDVILVSQYVMRLQQTDPERFESFMIMAQGHMLANALLCPDLQDAPKTYKGVTFFLDTPLLVRRIGVEGGPRRAAAESLLDLLQRLGATVAAFSHSRDELERVLQGAADHVEAPSARASTIVMEARRSGTTRSDLLLLAAQVDSTLETAGIEVKDTPRYIAEFQIDQSVFEELLDDEVSYYNPRAKEYDINSVRSVYVLRGRTSPRTVEKCRAVLVTSNLGFARAAWEYGQRHEQSRDVSSVITDFSLANMAWLKAPMGAPSIPTAEILAFAYAALQPSQKLLSKYLTEIERLEKQRKISARDHQLLRSSALAQEELMRLTLGDEEALTEETVTETLERVSSEIKTEESAKLVIEQSAHRETQQQLASERAERSRVQERLYWRCHRKATICAWIASGSIGLLLAVGIAGGLGLRLSNPVAGWSFAVGSGVLVLVTLANLIFGSTVRGMHRWVQNRCCTWFLTREAAATGLDLTGFR